MDDFTAMVHIVGDGIGDRAAEGFRPGRIVQNLEGGSARHQ